MSFQLRHIVFPARKPCKLTITCVFPLKVDPNESYTITFSPFSGLRKYGLRKRETPITAEDESFFSRPHPLTPEENTLTLPVTFPQEDCYICNISVGETVVSTLELYALEEDLFTKLPFKGDHHLHTTYSDGKDSPMYMVAAACKFGYDYCVITDHMRYEPSLIARDFYAPTGVDFLVIPGEEVHSPDNPVHIINLGGNASVNDWWRDHEDEYRAAVEKELAQMDAPMLERDRYAAAASQVMFDKIREADGVSILCHSHWILSNGFNETEDVTDYLVEHRRFDALELLAGAAGEVGSQLQLSYYRTRETMPILGDSDAHGCFGGNLEPGNFTVIFADGLSVEGVKQAIRSRMTIAGNEGRLYGDYRLVKYGYFLERNFFPDHARARKRLGVQMLRLAGYPGDPPQALLDSLKAIRVSQRFEEKRYQ